MDQRIKVRRGFHAALIIFVFLLGGCGPLPLPTPSTVLPATSTPASTPVPDQPTPRPETRLIRLWLPPRFDPANGTPAGALLQQRLDDFVALNPGLRIEVRIKSEETFVKNLQTTQTAAPTAVPDLVLLSRTGLEQAVTLGTLTTLDGLVDLPADPDWYPYARASARIQNSVFGIPLAADMLVLIGRAGSSGAFTGWEAFEARGNSLSFPAADAQSLFALAMLQSIDVPANAQGSPLIEQEALLQAMQFFERGRMSGAFSPLLTQYQTDEQSYQAFKEGRSSAVVTWSSRYLIGGTSGLTLQALPGIDGEPFTLVDTWSWALSTAEPDHQRIAVALIQHLSAPDFMSAWTLAAGYLPPRPSAVDLWTDANLVVTVDEISNSAQTLPPIEFRQKAGTPLSEALGNVLKGQTADEVMPALLEKLK